jgi:hypothetical protein
MNLLDPCLLGYDTVQLGRKHPTFRKKSAASIFKVKGEAIGSFETSVTT